jgi:nitrogen regulatory protein P-II 1
MQIGASGTSRFHVDSVKPAAATATLSSQLGYCYVGEQMTKIEAVIQPSKLDAVKDALVEIGVEGMTILEARGHGRQKGHTEFYRGREYSVDLLPKIKLELVTSDERAEAAIQAIITAARTGTIGDGKIFVTKVDEAIRIRNDERGDIAL